MYGLSLGVQRMPDKLPSIVYALLSGMNASTVGIIALAAVQLAEKAIQDRLTRILVIFGACAGLCYNALWYFPVLIVIGGAATAAWDVWLNRYIGKLRARYRARRRRARNEGGDAEDVTAAQSIPMRITRPEPVKRRAQTGGPSSSTISERDEAGPSRAGERRSTEDTTSPSITPVADIKTHNISIRVGVSLIIGFFGMLRQFLYVHVLTSRSILHSHHGHSRYHFQPHSFLRSLLQYVSGWNDHLWRWSRSDSAPSNIRCRSRLGVPTRLSPWSRDHPSVSRSKLQLLCLPRRVDSRADQHPYRFRRLNRLPRHLLPRYHTRNWRSIYLASHEDEALGAEYITGYQCHCCGLGIYGSVSALGNRVLDA